jgi:hypothetical protein
VPAQQRCLQGICSSAGAPIQHLELWWSLATPARHLFTSQVPKLQYRREGDQCRCRRCCRCHHQYCCCCGAQLLSCCCGAQQHETPFSLFPLLSESGSAKLQQPICTSPTLVYYFNGPSPPKENPASAHTAKFSKP